MTMRKRKDRGMSHEVHPARPGSDFPRLTDTSLPITPEPGPALFLLGLALQATDYELWHLRFVPFSRGRTSCGKEGNDSKQTYQHSQEIASLAVRWWRVVLLEASRQ